jgi:putative tricarboxylic transport membrane protein
MDMLFQGLSLVVTWPAIGYMLLGIIVGLYFGAVPGLGGMVGLSLLMPFTFGMDPAPAFAMLLGMYAVTTTSDTLSAVLLGVPGTAASAATVLDGYPLARQGQAMRALSAAFTVSAIGGVIGAFVMALMIPFLQPLILSFGPPEYFMLGVLGLTLVGTLSGKSVSMGLLAVTAGLMIAMIGYAPQGAYARLHFDSLYLIEGVPLVPMVLGMFAIPEIIDLSIKQTSIAGSVDTSVSKGQMRQGIRDAFTHRWLVIRSSIIGIYIGMLPGVGGSVADWVAYGHAVQSAKDKTRFGQGDIRGVIASESANNAMKGGALLPTIAFGIPGAPAMAVLLGAFLIHGLRPGPEMLTTHLDITYSLVWTLAIANIIGAGFLMLWGRQIARITFLRINLIIPFITLFIFMGSWMTSNSIGDWWMLLGAGLIGYIAKRGGLPRPPILLGFILGPIMENNLDLSYQVMGWSWVLRPIVLIMSLILVAALVHAVWTTVRRKVRGEDMAIDEDPDGQNRNFASIICLVSLAIFIAVYIMAQSWPEDASFFPIKIALFGIPLTLLTLAINVHSKNLERTSGLISKAEPYSKIIRIISILFGIILLSLVIGQLLALPIFIACYLWWWGRERWQIVFGQAFVGFGILYVMFETLLHVVWHPAMLDLL